MLLGKCELELQGDITTHLFEWLKKKRNVTLPNADVDGEELNCSYITSKNGKWHSDSGK